MEAALRGAAWSRLLSARGRGRPEYLWAVAAGVAIAIAVVFLAFGSDDDPGPASALRPATDGEVVLGVSDGPQSTEAAPAEGVADPMRGERRRIRRALRAGVDRAASLGGSVHAAALLSGWRAPVAIASDPADAGRAMRLWSTSKVLTAVALLRRAGWGDAPGQRLSPEVDAALAGALVRSENCRQRRIVLELQEAASGAEHARADLVRIVADAGARIALGADVEPPQPICRPFLETQRGSADPMAPTLLLGTSLWSMADAARFAHALASGRYGDAVADRVLGLMRVPKRASRETPPGDYTAALDWGAGRALAELAPAYKAGWGGSLLDDFFVTQVAALELEGGDVASLAVAFHPDVQPPKDDPGLTPGPAAVEAVMHAVGEELAPQ